MYRKNVASQYVYFCLVNSSTGAALTGATVTAYRALDNAAQATATGTTTELANGQYRFNLSQSDTNANNGSYLFTASGAVPVEKTVVFTAADPTDVAGFGLTRIDQTVGSRMATYTQPTGFLAATFPTTVASTTNITSASGVAVSSIGNNVITAASIAASALDSKGNWNVGKTGYSLTATTGLGNQTANITGTITTVTNLTNLPSIPANWLTAAGIASSALDDKGNWLKPTVAGRTLDVTATGAAGIDWANVESPGATVNLSATNINQAEEVNTAVVVGSINTDAITSTALASSAVNEIRDAVWNATLSSYTTAGTAGLALSDIVSRVTSTVKTMWDNLTSMITGSGASAKYTTTALEDAPAGGGGGGTDWTANERTAIRAILGVPSSGATPEDPTTGILDTIRDKTALITSGSVQTSLPVTSAGQITGPLYIGDDYLNANGRAFSWTISPRSGVTVGTATCLFGGSYLSSSWLVTGTVIDNGNNTWTLRFELPRTVTESLVAGFYAWSVELRNAAGTEITEVASGRNVDVRRKQT
jgi:hypothetical protein